MTGRILLIDDDELLCEALTGFLELSGYDVVWAGNGRAGLERLAAGGGFDLVILDLLMPEMDGIRFLRHIETEQLKVPPVLVVSASATSSVVDALAFPCVTGVIRKPVQPAKLLNRIAEVLGAQQGQ
jgi:CheY-like chemotaxis protein